MPYHTYESMMRDLQNLANTYPEICKLQSIGTSVQGRSIPLVKVGKYENKPAFLIEASIHADEPIAGEVTYLYIKYLLENRSKPEIRNLLENSMLYAVPIANPDGWLYYRTNAHGVDLNRNFPKYYCKCSCNTPSPGPSPLSEPESRALANLITSRQFKWALSFHAGTEVLAYPWSGSYEKPKDEETYIEVAKKIMDEIRSRGYPTYPYGQIILQKEFQQEFHYPETIKLITGEEFVIYCAGGTSLDYYYDKGTLGYVLEISYSKQPAEIQYYFERTLPVPLTLHTLTARSQAVPSWMILAPIMLLPVAMLIIKPKSAPQT